jgi:subtilisin
MRRAPRLLVLLVLVLSAFSVPLTALAAASQSNQAEPYIVTFSPSTHGANILAAALAQRNGFRVDHSFDTIIKGFSARLTPSQVALLRASPSVAGVEADLPTHITNQTVPTGIERIGDDSNSTASIDGTDNPLNIDVATLDTGIDPNHPDLNVVGGYNCTTSDTSAWADDNGHGTHVAGTIAARDNGTGVVGVAPGARLWSVKVFTSSGSGFVSWIVCGMNWIAQHSNTIEAANFSGAWSGSNTANCGVTTFGWYQYVSDTAHQAVCNLVNTYGVPFIVAAGNDGKNASNTLPAAYPETIAVGALADSDGQPGGHGPNTSYGADDTRASFSNYGSTVTLYAPGVNILSTWVGGGYATASGTSMATPHVTGAVALYLIDHPGATPSQVKQALIANGESGSWGAQTGNQPLLNVNNAAFGGGVVTPTHDVEVTSIDTLSQATQNTQTTVRVHIANQGNQTESNLNVVLTDGSSTVGSQSGISLAPGGAQDVDIAWTPSTSGSHTLKATASNGNTNHNMSTAITVGAVVHDVEVTSIAPQNAVADGVANTVKVHVVNQGNQDESGLTVSLTDNSNAVGSNQSISGTLHPGDGADVSFSWTPSGVSTHSLQARVWNANTDHSTSANVSVAALTHDVQVTSVSVPSQVTQGQSVNISVSVKNVGTTTENVVVSVTSSPTNAAGEPGSQSVTLGPGDATTLNFGWGTSGATAEGAYAITGHASIAPNVDATPSNNDLQAGNQISVQAPVPTSTRRRFH